MKRRCWLARAILSECPTPSRDCAPCAPGRESRRLPALTRLGLGPDAFNHARKSNSLLVGSSGFRKSAVLDGRATRWDRALAKIGLKDLSPGLTERIGTLARLETCSSGTQGMGPDYELRRPDLERQPVRIAHLQRGWRRRKATEIVERLEPIWRMSPSNSITRRCG